jgi:RNA polymerase sigma-70 factor (ECF subfamily)
MAVGEVDGEPAILILHREADRWTPASIVRLDVTDHRITRVMDYSHCPWILPAASSVLVAEP